MTGRTMRLAVILPTVLGIAALAAVAYLLAGNTGLLVSAVAVQLFLLTAVLLLARGWLRGESRRREDKALHQRLDRVDAQLDAVRGNLNKRSDELKRRLGSVLADGNETRKRMDRRIGQLDFLIGLYYDIKPTASLPATAGWAASPDLLRYLYDTVTGEQRSSILECGSGVSTLIMAYALRERGHGKIVSLDHDARYAAKTRAVLERHDLHKWAEVRVAELREVELEGERWPWYDTAQLPEGPFDLVVVDGPPEATRSQARFPAVPLLYDRLTPDAMVVLDDHQRPDEQAAGRRWVEAHGDLRPEVLKHHKDTLVLRRDGVEDGASSG